MMNFTTQLFSLAKKKGENQPRPNLKEALNQMLTSGYIPLFVIEDMNHPILEEFGVNHVALPADIEPVYYVLVLLYLKPYEA